MIENHASGLFLSSGGCQMAQLLIVIIILLVNFLVLSKVSLIRGEMPPCAGWVEV